MSDIFNSYAAEDRDHAQRLAEKLEKEGWSVWWDRTIPAGSHFYKVIEDALESASCVIVLWSKHSVESTWVCAEADEGLKRSILVPVRLDEAAPPLPFRQIQTADLNDWRGNEQAPAYRRLIGDLKGILAAQAAAAASEESGTGSENRPDTARRPFRCSGFVKGYICVSEAMNDAIPRFASTSYLRNGEEAY